MQGLTALLILTLQVPSEAPVVVPPKDTFRIERAALYTSAAADIITTRIAIRNGAFEGNPLLTPIIGKQPSTAKLLGVKAVSIAITELTAGYLRKKGEQGRAKAAYWISTVLWTFAAGMNLQFAW
jgi:hypothetical protein